MTVPESLRGKKVRCKGCQGVVAVPAAKPAKATVKPAPAPEPLSEEEDAKNPYGVQHMSLAPLCPHCAYELDPPDAKVCLHCGYHMVKRSRAASIKTLDHTGGDYFLWLAPGILAFLGFFALIGLFVYFHWFLPYETLSKTAADDLMKDRMEAFAKENLEWHMWMYHPGIEVWLVVFLLFMMWKCIKFAFIRLILNYTPPEKIIEK